MLHPAAVANKLEIQEWMNLHFDVIRLDNYTAMSHTPRERHERAGFTLTVF